MKLVMCILLILMVMYIGLSKRNQLTIEECSKEVMVRIKVYPSNKNYDMALLGARLLCQTLNNSPDEVIRYLNTMPN